MPAGDVHIPASRHPDEHGRSLPPEPAPRPAPDSRIDDLRDRAETAERLRHDADERARGAEDRAREADELTRLAEARARASEERALAAGELVDAAEARADGMSSAVDAANETLARLVRACELLEHESETRGPELEVLRAALEAERGQRTQLETQLRHPQPSEDMLALKVRIAELERQLREQPPAAVGQPAPPPPAPVAEPPQAYAPPPVVEPPPVYAPPPALVVESPQAYAPPPAPVSQPPPPVAEPEPEVVVEEAYSPSVSPTIDIIGEPGVPYVPALAPMPSNDVPTAKKAPKSASAKARGLRRLISAIKRGA